MCVACGAWVDRQGRGQRLGNSEIDPQVSGVRGCESAVRGGRLC